MFAVKDPEDSDVNSMFAAIEMYDELRKVEPDVEVATIAGSPSVGYQSDRILASQLEQVIEKVKPEEVILVSDGAEDEAVHPIIASRVRISSVRRVVVKQHQAAESTYYILKKALKEKHFLTPVALIMMVLGLFTISSVVAGGLGYSGPLVQSLPILGWAVVGLVIGLYFLSYTYEWPHRLSNWLEDASHSLKVGRVRISFTAISLIILVVGGVIVYVATSQLTANLPNQPWPLVLEFSMWFLWVAMGSALAFGVGRALDALFATGRFQYSYLVTGFSLLGITAGMFGSLQAFRNLLLGGATLIVVLTEFAVWMMLSIAIGIGGGIFGRKVRRAEKKLRAAKEAKLQADGGADERPKKRID
jgi:putative membrane protein